MKYECNVFATDVSNECGFRFFFFYAQIIIIKQSVWCKHQTLFILKIHIHIYLPLVGYSFVSMYTVFD